MTWFDALLITLLALVTALGARRGLAGLVWGVAALALAFMVNLLGLDAPLAGVLALALGAVSGLVISRLIPDPLERPWQMVAGGLGGVLLGGVLISTLALAFPMAVRATPSGKQSLYPSPDLSPGLYSAVSNSAIQNGLRNMWTASVASRTLIIPDRAR